MVYKTRSQEKLLQNHIQRQSKPFIDKHLQLQLPNYEQQNALQLIKNYPALYTYHFNKSSHLFKQQKLDLEVNKAMDEAEQAYQAWQKMKDILKGHLVANKA